jgi:hypothetical protein
LPLAVVQPRVRNRRRESLRCKEVDKPAAHLAGTADDQYALAIAFTLRDDSITFLAGERRTNQLAQNALRQIRIQTLFFSLRASHVEHVLLAGIIARSGTRGLLGTANLTNNTLALGHQIDQLPVDTG